ncbi:MAG: hypothetical protein MJ252_18875 [archaeon]|nr:hypothetical protein [archaeon]
MTHSELVEDNSNSTVDTALALNVQVKKINNNLNTQYGKTYAFCFKNGDPIFVIGPDCK